jgi:hypothetical protein
VASPSIDGVLAHRRHHDAVGQRQRADGERREETRRPLARGDLGGGAVQGLRVAGQQCHFGAFSGECQRNGLADARRLPPVTRARLPESWRSMG